MQRAIPLGRQAPGGWLWMPLVGVAIALLAGQTVWAERARSLAMSPLVQRPLDDAGSLRERCAAAGVTYPPPDPRIVVTKSSRTLELYSGTTLVARFRVGLGFSPRGDKAREGDGRTPEGELTIVTRNERSRYRKFLGLSYPRPSDARAAHVGIAEEELRAIDDAAKLGAKPPWDTPLGGAVGIHGHGGSADWTSGCIALDDPAIELLWEAAPHGTPVRVVP